tara:strand:+ start:62356 stop:63762 length:1407 start_codon:yes stop_codon:yes gene_type:complete
MKAHNLITSKRKRIYILGICMAGIFLVGCEDFLEAETPLNEIANQEVFNNENTATAALTTLYGKLRDQALLTGNLSGTTFTMGLYADELDYYSTPGNPLESFYLHQVLPSNTTVQSIWGESFAIIHQGNEVLQGLRSSSSLDDSIKNQLTGEALFVRALLHFYLVNIYGDIPYITSIDYVINSQVERLPVTKVYNNIIQDLLEAKGLLSADYISAERVRANISVVSALLARVYLYQGQWQKAETQSSLVIDNTGLFDLEPDVDKVFLKGSRSTIWQFKPKSEGDNTIEASNFIFSSGPPPLIALNPVLFEAMEEEDVRKTSWIGTVTNGTASWYYPFKYKQNNNTGASLEYSIVFRLAEQYLIRAEARAMQANITGAQQDLSTVRNRAGLGDAEASTTEELLDLILKERRFELFTEYGHRWFDLRRFGMAGAVLSPIKPGWRPTDILFPIPESELLINPNLNPQNPGY